MRNLYSQYINDHNVEGSNKASSYIRALDLLSGIINKNVWEIREPQQIEDIYEEILVQQRRGERGLFQGQEYPSYWRNRFYSAALKSYQQFLVLESYEGDLWKIYNSPTIAASELSRRLSEKEIKGVKFILPKDGQKGKDVMREVKARLNQNFFRKMVLSNYNTQCCLTGLNIPEVLRASHILAWSESEENRLNPANGLCLSATYDLAFDRFLISFNEEYRMMLSPRLREYYTNQAFQEYFKSYEGKPLAMPSRFKPSQEFLEIHRERTLR